MWSANEWWIGKDVTGSGHDIVLCFIPEFTWRDWLNLMITSAALAGLWAKIFRVTVFAGCNTRTSVVIIICPVSFRETCQWLKFPLNGLRAQSRVSPVVGLQKKLWQTIEKTSGYVRSKRVNKWPNSITDIWWWCTARLFRVIDNWSSLSSFIYFECTNYVLCYIASNISTPPLKL